ncbi:MAG: hypothetical protein KIT73_18560, partial [Burkholderiales bacterium]|nr:hypothetical protein [Burkholderiales bacterium]
ACPIALYTGRLDAAERFITQLLDRAEKHGLTFWQIEGRCLNGMLLVRSGDIVQGLHVLRTALDDLPETTFRRRNRYIAFLGELADVLGTVGETGAGLDVIEEALARSERNEEGWCIAELLRIKGELLSSVGRPDAALEAGCHFVRALERARQQGALAWELRCAMSLARLYRDQDQPDQARMQLAAVFDRFTEGADTADLKAARALLDSLA